MGSERVSAHCQRVYRIVTRYGDEVGTVAHDDVFALAYNAETTLFQRPHRPEMINAGNFRHCYTDTSTSRTSEPRRLSLTAAR